ncbi:MAG: FliM/FliN family flagellar motor switch protein [Rhizobiaceae bacterium]
MSVSTSTATSSNESPVKIAVPEKELDRAIEELRAMSDAQRGGVAPDSGHSRRNVTMQIPVEVNVVLGSAEMSVAELAGLQSGSIIQLDRRVGEPVDLIVKGVKIAKGEITLLENESKRFGFRITDILG